MRRHAALILGIVIGVLVTACSSSTEPKGSGYRTAIEQAKVSLEQSVNLGQESVGHGVAVKAALLAESNPVFSVGAIGSGAMHDVRVDAQSGAVLSNTEIGAGDDPCPGSIPLAEAIPIAEARIGGHAVQIQPDDDDHCLREVIVLGANDKLWEVKLARDGAILEVEVADSDGD
jgi:uncharacterized membrane protein YkoI